MNIAAVISTSCVLLEGLRDFDNSSRFPLTGPLTHTAMVGSTNVLDSTSIAQDSHVDYNPERRCSNDFTYSESCFQSAASQFTDPNIGTNPYFYENVTSSLCSDSQRTDNTSGFQYDESMAPCSHENYQFEPRRLLTHNDAFFPEIELCQNDNFEDRMIPNTYTNLYDNMTAYKGAICTPYSLVPQSDSLSGSRDINTYYPDYESHHAAADMATSSQGWLPCPQEMFHSVHYNQASPSAPIQDSFPEQAHSFSQRKYSSALDKPLDYIAINSESSDTYVSLTRCADTSLCKGETSTSVYNKIVQPALQSSREKQIISNNFKTQDRDDIGHRLNEHQDDSSIVAYKQLHLHYPSSDLVDKGEESRQSTETSHTTCSGYSSSLTEVDNTKESTSTHCARGRNAKEKNTQNKKDTEETIKILQYKLENLEESRRKSPSTSCLSIKSLNQEQSTIKDRDSLTSEVTKGASILDVDHMICSGVTVAGFKPRAIIRKRCKTAIPNDNKDNGYWYKRRKNNDSARKSRESKKEKEKNFYKRALELEYENFYLHECLCMAEAELASLGHTFVPPVFGGQSHY